MCNKLESYWDELYYQVIKNEKDLHKISKALEQIRANALPDGTASPVGRLFETCENTEKEAKNDRQ
jgi:hypothetical protein